MKRKFTLFKNIESLATLTVAGETLGLRVLESHFTYDIDATLLDEKFGKNTIMRLGNVLHKSVLGEVPLSWNKGAKMFLSKSEERKRVEQYTYLKPELVELIERVLVIADFKNGNGDTDVVAIGSPKSWARNWCLPKVEGFPDKFIQFQGGGMKDHGTEFYLIDENYSVVKVVPEDNKTRGDSIYFRLKTETDDLALANIKKGKALLDFSFCLEADSLVYEFGCRTATVWEDKSRPVVEYIKLVDLKKQK